MKTIITGIVSLLIGLLVGLILGKSINWNAITAICTAIMAVCAILALFDWKKQQRVILYNDRRKALKQLNNFVLKLDDVYKKFMPSYKEIQPILREIEGIRVYLEYDKELKDSIKDYCDIYSNIYSFTKVIDRINIEEDIAEGNKCEIRKRIQNIVEQLVLKVPITTKNLKNVIQKKIDI